MNARYYRKIAKLLLDPIGLGRFARRFYIELKAISDWRWSLIKKGHMINNEFGPILLVGSGRSGTTWITEILTSDPWVQEVFEPLAPFWNKAVVKAVCWNGSPYSIDGWYLDSASQDEEWRRVWEDIFQRKYRNYWTDINRNFCRSELNIFKEIRANLMLGFLWKEFAPRFIYIIRNPISVIESRVTAKWEPDLRKLREQSKLMDCFFNNQRDFFLDDVSLVVKHAVWWSVENKVATETLKKIPHYRLVYEDAIKDKSAIANDVRRWVGLLEHNNSKIKGLNTLSRMSDIEEKYRLSEDEEQQVWEIVNKLAPGLYRENRDNLLFSGIQNSRNGSL